MRRKWRLNWKIRIKTLNKVKSILRGHWWFLTVYLEDGVIFQIMDSHDMSFLTCVLNFHSLAWLAVCQEPPSSKSILGGCWWFLSGYLENWVILDIIDCHDMWFLTCVPKFSSLAWIEVCQEPPRPRSHSWRTLMVPHWILGGWDHSWHHWLSWYVNLDLCAKFQLSCMNKSVSRTPHPWSHT